MSKDIESLSKYILDCAISIYGNDFMPFHRPVFEGN